MTKMLAVAALAVMFASPSPGQAAENGLSRNGSSLDDGTIPDSADSAVLIKVELPR